MSTHRLPRTIGALMPASGRVGSATSPVAVAATTTEGRFLDGLALLVPVLLAVDFVGAGRLYLAEVVLLLLLPPLLWRHQESGLAPIPAAFVVLAVVWLAGQIATDIFRATPLQDIERGWAKIAFTLSNFVALYLIFENRARRFVLFGCGLACGLALHYLVNPGPLGAADHWKFGYGYSVTLILVLVACTKVAASWRLARCGLLVAAGLLNLFHDYRSLAGVCVLAAFYSATAELRGRKRSRAPVKFLLARALALAGLFGGIALLFVSLYGHLASTGALGTSASQKYETQASGSLGLLLHGRPEILVSSRAVADSPLLGHGSWAKDPKYLEMQIGDGLQPSPSTLSEGLIPTHSYLMGAWVEAGLLGTPIWIWALFLAAGVLSRLYRRDGPLVPLTAFAAFAMSWNVFFSPYGSFERLIAPYYVLILVAASRTLRARDLSFG
jgi:hypothetical protein